MSLIFNGTTIPTDVANALNFNGTNITQVIYNGTVVWTQSLPWLTPTYSYTAGWGGFTSYYQNTSGGGYTAGFINSGSYLAADFSINSVGGQGTWITINNQGVYSTTVSSPSNINAYTGGWSGLESSGSQIRMIGNTNGGWLTLAKSVAWSGGTSTASSSFSYNTSGFSYRFGYGSSYGSWITLS